MSTVPPTGKTSVAGSRANQRAGDRLLAARGSIYQAFDNLGCGFDHDQVAEFLAGTPTWQTLPENDRWKVAGMVMGFAIVAVESDRHVREMSRRHV